MVNRMKVKEIRELTTAEMLDQEKQLKEELFNLRFQLATGQLENTARIKEVRNRLHASKLCCVNKLSNYGRRPLSV